MAFGATSVLIQNPTVTVKAIFTSSGFEESTSDEDVGIVLDTTSYYAEQGGQVNTCSLRFLFIHVVFLVVWSNYSTNIKCQVTDAKIPKDIFLRDETQYSWIDYLSQIYDTGVLEGPNGAFTVREVQIYGGYVLHIGSINNGGKISVGDKVTSQVFMKVYHWSRLYLSDLLLGYQVHPPLLR